MPPTPDSFPANWYPAPNDPRQVRYWDGIRWTEHFAPRDPRLTPDMLTPPGPDAEPVHVDAAPVPALPAEVPAAASPAPERKVGFFGARGLAKDLAAENAQLRSALEKVGALSLAEIQQRTAVAREELAEVSALLSNATTLAEVHEQLVAARAELADLRAALERDRARQSQEKAQAAAELDALRQQALDVRHAIDVQEFRTPDMAPEFV